MSSRNTPCRFLTPIGVLALASAIIAPARPAAADPPITERVVKRTLPNGLRVLVLPRRTAPVVTTMLWYRVGARDEVPGATGCAHFLEHLLFKGTQRLKKGDIDRLTYRGGGTNNAFTSHDYTAYEFHFPRATWQTALTIEADRMRNTVIDPKEFEAERQVVMEERRGGTDDPVQQFGEQLLTASFSALPYRNPIIGWMEDLKRLPREEVVAFYKRYYVPANATLVVTGDVSPDEAHAAVRKAFAGIPRLSAPQRPVIAEPARIGQRELSAALPTQVARLAITLPAPKHGHRDSVALELMQYVLSEGRLGRLHQRLVEKDRLATSVGVSVNQYRDGGLISVDADALPGVSLESIETALWEELGRIAREPVTARELQRARNQFLADWVTGVNTSEATATVLGYNDVLGGYQSLSTYLAQGEKTTAADIQRVAQSYLRRDRATTGRLVPSTTSSASRFLDSPFPFREGGWGGRPGERYPLSASSGAIGLPAAYRHTRDSKGRLSLGPHPQPLSRGERRAASAVSAELFQALRPLERTLPNGMRLVLLENHDVPSVTLSTRVLGGSFAEDPSRAGLASLLTDLLDQGTARKSPDEVSEGLEHVGAYFESAADGLATTSTLRCLSRQTAGLLPLYAEMMRSPSFPEAQIEKERSRVLTSLTEEAEDATTVALKAFAKLVYPDHPAGRNVEGEPETVKAITRQDLVDFHARWFQPQNAILVAVGDFKAAEFARNLESVFGDWRRGPAAPALNLPPLERQTERRTRRIPMERDQMQILLGHLGIRRTDPDYVPLQVMDSILGQSAGFTARIPFQLRDVQGLAYTVDASITSSAGSFPGLFRAYIGTEAKNENAAIAGLLAEIRRIRNEPVKPSELSEARNFLSSNYVFGFETQDQLAGYLQAVIRYGFGYDYRRRYVQQVRQVTAQQVLAAARKRLDPIHYSLVVVGKTQANGKDTK